MFRSLKFEWMWFWVWIIKDSQVNNLIRGPGTKDWNLMAIKLQYMYVGCFAPCACWSHEVHLVPFTRLIHSEDEELEAEDENHCCKQEFPPRKTAPAPVIGHLNLQRGDENHLFEGEKERGVLLFLGCPHSPVMLQQKLHVWRKSKSDFCRLCSYLARNVTLTVFDYLRVMFS